MDLLDGLLSASGTGYMALARELLSTAQGRPAGDQGEVLSLGGPDWDHYCFIASLTTHPLQVWG